MKKLNKSYNAFFSLVYFKYQKIGEKQIPGFYAVCFLTVLEAFNFLSLVFLYMFVFNINKQSFQNYYCYLIFFPILIFNYIYFYLKKQKERSILEYENISPEKRKEIKTWVIGYIITTVITTVIFLWL